MRLVTVSEIKRDLARLLRVAASREIVITRRGKPAGVLIRFENEDKWLDYRLERNPKFLHRVAQARKDIRAGRGVRLEEVPQ